jgi:trehalose 6-phosphate phosphatase
VRAVLAAHPRGLLTDVDGTISAIAPTPDAAVLLPGVREILTAAHATFDLVAAISGRAARDARRLVGVAQMLYVGNHGMEILAPSAREAGAERWTIAPTVQPYIPIITAALDEVERDVVPRFPGMVVERKGVTGSVHYRLVADLEEAESAVELTLAHLFAGELRITHGKQVIELRPPVDIDKGTAVEDLVRGHHLRSAIYLGDDSTDLDAFRALSALAAQGEFTGFAVAVLHPEAPPQLAEAADLILSSVDAVPAFLRWLISAAQKEA